MSNNAEVAVTPTRPGIARQGGAVHLLVQVTPPDRDPDVARRPVALALVVDRSGSMGSAIEPGNRNVAGDDRETPCKLDYVKEAALRMLDLMADGDAVSLVTFDDTVHVTKPLTVLSASSRRALRKTIRAVSVGASTNIDGALRAGLHQLAAASDTYSAKLVLLSDGMANVGECRPAVLGEVAAGAAHNGITTSTLGVGFDYHLGLMSHVAECGNGEFHHVAQLDDLDGILAGELLDASAATARNVEVTMNVAAAVAVGSNLNRLRQTDIADGVRVSLGDMVRSRDFLIELTTPVEMAGDHLDVRVVVEGLGADGLIEASHALELSLVTVEEEAALPVDESIVARAAVGLQMQADMDASLAAENGDLDAAANAVTSLRSSAVQLSAAYGTTVASSAWIVGTVDYLDALSLRMQTPQSPRVLKSRFDMAKKASRGRARLIGPCPVCGEHAFFEGRKGGRVLRNCTACGHVERLDT